MQPAASAPEPEELSVTIVQSRGKAGRYAVLAAVFVAAGVWLYRQGSSDQTWAILSIAFFGLGLVVFLAQLIRPGTLVLDARGITQAVLARTAQ